MTSDALHDSPALREKALHIDRRLSVLESRFDTTLAMLADKADLAHLKADLHGDAARLRKWMAATAITIVFGVGAMLLAMGGRLHGA